MVNPPPASNPASRDLEMQQTNREFYDPLWHDSKLIPPERFNTWPLIRRLSGQHSRRLEIGPGLRPRLPLIGTEFIDLSPPAVAKLNQAGAKAVIGVISTLPFADGAFDLVCALDIIEHVDDDERALAEIARVSSNQAVLIISVPLHPDRWTDFDEECGHRRRYEPEVFLRMLREHGFVVEESASYGMQPKSSRLVDLGVELMKRRRKRAMWVYNHLIMPLALLFQSKFQTEPGVIDLEPQDQILLVCRKVG